jgi:hypothetical protein
MPGLGRPATARAGQRIPQESLPRERRFMEHRWGQRQATNLPVRVAQASGALGFGRVLNVSTTGAYLQTPVPLRQMALIFLTPINEAQPERAGARLAAWVVRMDEKGVGLEWQEPVRRAAATRLAHGFGVSVG